MKKLIVFLTIFSLLSINSTIYASEVSGKLFMKILNDPLSHSSDSATGFKVYLRTLWSDQVIWTKDYIESVMTDLDDVSLIEDKIINNQKLAGEAIKPYYGNFFGNILSGLLREHVVIAIKIINATKNGNIKDLRKYKKKGRANANKVAFFLSLSGNPFLNKQKLKDLFYQHLDYIAMQADFTMKNDLTDETKTYNKALNHALKIADLLAKAVIHQFPDKFNQ